MTVRTAQLAQVIDATPGFRTSVIYTVPSGRRAIIKELVVVAVGTGAAVNTLYFASILAFTRTSPTGVDIQLFPRWTVLNAGESITWGRNVQAGGANELLISGTELAT